MKILDRFTAYFANFKEYLTNEVELVKLTIMRKLGNVLGLIFSAIFIMFLFHITIALIGIWIGFYLSEIYDSTSIGFGITVLIYIAWTMISIIFRNALLVKPFSKLIINSMLELEELDKLKQEAKNEDEN